MKRNSILLCAMFLASQAMSVHAMENSKFAVAAFSFGAPIATSLIYRSACNVLNGEETTKNDLVYTAFDGVLCGVLYCASYGITKRVMGGKPLPNIAKLGIIFSAPILGSIALNALVNKLSGKDILDDAEESTSYGAVTGLGTCAFAVLAYYYGLLK